MKEEMTVVEAPSRLKHFQQYEENPLVEGLIVPIRERRRAVAVGTSALTDLDLVPVIARREEVDKDEFIKLFTTDLQIWFDLGKTAFRVCLALIKAIQEGAINQDRVAFDPRMKICKELGISNAVFYRGVIELLAKGFIARSSIPNIFFFNPRIFFNGDRVRFVKEYVQKSNDSVFYPRLSKSKNAPVVSTIGQRALFDESFENEAGDVRLTREELIRRMDNIDNGLGEYHEMIEVD